MREVVLHSKVGNKNIGPGDQASREPGTTVFQHLYILYYVVVHTSASQYLAV